jgi:hypothetical protein
VKKFARVFRDLLVSIWAGLLIIRVTLFLARFVGVIGAFETVGIWLGYEDAITVFEHNIDNTFWYVIDSAREMEW